MFLEAGKIKYSFTDFSVSHIKRTKTQTNICCDKKILLSKPQLCSYTL